MDIREILDLAIQNRNSATLEKAIQNKPKRDILDKVDKEFPSYVRSYINSRPTLTPEKISEMIISELTKHPPQIIEKTIKKEIIKPIETIKETIREDSKLKDEIEFLKKELELFKQILPLGGSGVIGLPSMEKQGGKALTNDGSKPYWATLSGSSGSTVLDKNTFLEVAFGNGNGTEQNFVMSFFSTVNFSGLSGYALTDTGGNYNPATDFYTIPQTGTYLIMTQLRVTDSEGTQESYGQGAGNLNQDSPQFSWFETNTTRNGSLNQRISFFNKGDLIRMFAYSDTGSLHASDGRMQIILLTS